MTVGLMRPLLACCCCCSLGDGATAWRLVWYYVVFAVNVSRFLPLAGEPSAIPGRRCDVLCDLDPRIYDLRYILRVVCQCLNLADSWIPEQWVLWANQHGLLRCSRDIYLHPRATCCRCIQGCCTVNVWYSSRKTIGLFVSRCPSIAGTNALSPAFRVRAVVGLSSADVSLMEGLSYRSQVALFLFGQTYNT